MAKSNSQSKQVRKQEKDLKDNKIVKLIEIPLWLVAILFIVTTSIFFGGQLSGDSFFWEDFVEFVYPTQTFAAVESSMGRIPFWNPYSFSGMPFLADLQAGFFYPLHRVLTFLVNSDGRIPIAALQFIIILHYFIAQLAMYFLAKSWKISSIGSIISAISYAFSLMLVCHAIHPMIVEHLAWFPLVIMFYFKAINELRYDYAIYSGLIFGFSMLSGHPQLTLYEALFLFLMFLWFFIAKLFNSELKGSAILHYLISAAIPIIIAFGIFAIQYLPSQELAANSQRAESSYEKSAEGSLEYSQLFTALVPKLFGYIEGNYSGSSVPYYLPIKSANGKIKSAPYYYYWESAFYLGIGAIILGLFGAITVRTRTNAFLIFIAIFGVLFAFGANGFVFPFFYNLPFFGTFRNPARMMLFFVIGFSLLAGFGFDNIKDSIKKKTEFLILAAISLFVFIMSWLISGGAVPSAIQTPEASLIAIKSFGTTALLISLIISTVLLLAQKGILNITIAGLILVVIIFIDLFNSGSGFNTSKDNPDKFYESGELKELFTAEDPNNQFRVNTRLYNPSFQAMRRNQGLIDRIQLIEGYNPLILKRVIPPINSRDTVNMLYNVKYQVEIDNEQGPRFVENLKRFPRAWLVGGAIITDEISIDRIMRQNGFDYSRIAIFENKLSRNYPENPDSTKPGNVKCLKYESNRSKYIVEASTDAIMVLSEIWYPAWKAYINGKPVEIHRANYCFRAIEIPRGRHEVEFIYQSSTFSLGMWISILTTIVSLAGIFIFKKRNISEHGN